MTTEQEWAGRPDTTLNVALSYRALAALGLPAWILDGFPAELRDGMAARAERLGDDPSAWDDELRDLEVLLVVHARAPTRSRPRPGAGSARWARTDSGLELAHAQPAALLGQQREHFGFTDGFSQPAIEGVAREDVRGQGIPYKRVPWWPLSRTRWRAIKPGEFVLGYEDEDRGPAPAPPAPFDRNASYMVWRKLHQDVGGLPRPARRAGPAAGARRGARRGQARRPLARRQPARPAPRRAATPSSATTSCAPTTSATATTSAACAARAAPTCGAPTRGTRWAGRGGSTARHRILRRGMPYGPALPDGAEDDGEARGLLFVCLQASIARQFEIVQSQWCNDGNAFGLGREADPITGPAGGEVRHIIEGDPPHVVSPLRSYVECRGGEYLVVPAISALQALPAL